MERKVRLDHLLGVYNVGSGDWSWTDEYDKLIDQTDTQKLLARIREEGIHEPVLLGTDGRVWDGHHRIIIAMHLGIDSVSVEFAGDDGALNALLAEKRAEWEAEQGTEEPEWEYGCRSSAHVMSNYRDRGALILQDREHAEEHGYDCPSPSTVRRPRAGDWEMWEPPVPASPTREENPT